MKATITQTTIDQPAIYHVTDKASGAKFFLVKSDSCRDCYHEVRWSDELTDWQCNGEHCKFQRGGTNCKHARACKEVLRARRAAERVLQASEEKHFANLTSAQRRETAPLESASSRGFSLMR